MVDATELPETLSDDEIHRLVFETFGQARFTQDSPFMPEVWTAFIRVEEACARSRVLGGSPPDDADLVDLLITPWRSVPTGEVAQELRNCVRSAWFGTALTPDRTVQLAAIAPGWTHVAARLSFVVAARAILPLCGWWQSLPKRSRTVTGVRRLLSSMVEWSEDMKEAVETGGGWEQLRFMALAGFVMHLRSIETLDTLRGLRALLTGLSKPLYGDRPDAQGQAAASLSTVLLTYKGLVPEINEVQNEKSAKAKPYVFAVNTNRSASPAIVESRATIKADAAQNLFQIETQGIVWAIIDSGIDARHPAFLDRENRDGPTAPAATRSRIRKTYDFTNLRQLLATGELQANPHGWPTQDDVVRLNARQDVKDALERLKARAQSPRDLDWSLLDPLILVPHDTSYAPPKADHGTHVAGILAADWPTSESKRDEDLVGMCKDMHLYDLRVFDHRGEGDEFAIMAALSFVGWLNRDRANPAIHGVNLSLALTHHVDAFACGRTPICDVCNELAGSGTVVVAAAGNTGFEAQGRKLSRGTGYRMISITDPGNADGVITVGSVHKSHPHAYGVSYFSGRGPTGDGRRKPDLVAPGEKIESTVSDRGTRRLDGTSMAAPHVSGAAALLMSRHRELVGAPRRIKEILMKTATDLGREPHFQGAGLVDVLRALQSV